MKETQNKKTSLITLTALAATCLLLSSCSSSSQLLEKQSLEQERLQQELAAKAQTPTPTALKQSQEIVTPSIPTERTTSTLIKPDPNMASIPEVEVLWEIPKKPVSEFIVQYGFAKSSLTNQKIIPISKVEKFHDPDFGYVYRCLLENIPAHSRLFVRIGTSHQGTPAEFSSVFEVEPTT